jgi:ornithine cyclodeaminase/alanine dehydrogenase-like protein (mu-crystallin family)
MPSYVPGAALAAKVISVFPRNHLTGMPSHQGLIAMFDDTDGRLVCIMDATTVTAARTAAVSTVAVSALAPPQASVLTIVGSGVQAKAHLASLTDMGHFAEVRVVGRDLDRASVVAALRPDTVAFADVQAAVLGADVVACCTAAKAPVLEHAWLERGCHVLSVGSGPELDQATVRAGLVFVEWRGAVTNPPPAGASELQGLDPDCVVELGTVLGDGGPARIPAARNRIFKSTGLAVEDAAAARVIYDAAVAAEVGEVISWQEAEAGR